MMRKSFMMIIMLMVSLSWQAVVTDADADKVALLEIDGALRWYNTADGSNYGGFLPPAHMVKIVYGDADGVILLEGDGVLRCYDTVGNVIGWAVPFSRPIVEFAYADADKVALLEIDGALRWYNTADGSNYGGFLPPAHMVKIVYGDADGVILLEGDGVLRCYDTVGNVIGWTVPASRPIVEVAYVGPEINTPPVANAGPDQTVEQAYYQGANVTLDGSGSSDANGDPLTYSWTWSGGSDTGVSPTVSLPLGTTTITLVVNDGTVDSDPDTVDITVEDTTAPTLALDAIVAPADLWPPNHKMVPVATITGYAVDICDADLDIAVAVSVVDAEGGDGGPAHDGDWELVGVPSIDAQGNLAVDLNVRSERSGRGDGRKYLVTVTLTDDSGNFVTAGPVLIADVAHDRRK